MRTESHHEVDNNQPPALPVIRLHEEEPTRSEIFLDKLTKDETSVEGGSAVVTPAKLRTHTLYKGNVSYGWLFQRQEEEVHCDTFLSKYEPYNRKLISQHRKNFTTLKVAADKLYFGEVYNGKCHGVGIVVFRDGRLYEGALENNLRQGEGLFVTADKSWYYGEYMNDSKDGTGLEVHRFGNYYGGYVNGLKHGNGMLVARDLTYTGQWRLGIINGFGTLETEESRYEGNFSNFLKHGHGRENFKNGDEYVGQYINGKPESEGQYRWAQQSCFFKGTFKNGQRSGKGMWTSSNGDKYTGSYEGDIKSGFGEFHWRSGNFYKGNFLDDLREGYGEMFWNDGCVYKGQWHRGVQHGKGQLYIVGQDTFVGMFENNMLVSLFPSPEKLKNRSMLHLNTSRKESFDFAKTAAVRDRAASEKDIWDLERSRFKKLPVHPIGGLTGIKSRSKSKSKKAKGGLSDERSPKHNDHSPGGHHRHCKACAAKQANSLSKRMLPAATSKKLLQRAYNIRRRDNNKRQVVNHFMRNHASQYQPQPPY